MIQNEKREEWQMKWLGNLLKFVFKLVLATLALAAAVEAVSLGRERCKNRYLVDVDLNDEE